MRHGGNLTTTFDIEDRHPFDYITCEKPKDRDRFQGQGLDGPMDREATLSMLDRLSLKMLIDGRRIDPPVDNWSIPAGYTYLGQLIAHDLTFNVARLPKGMRNPNQIRNLRSSALDLDCIYGGGPDSSPWLYQLDGPPNLSIPRKRLRLGLTRPPEGKAGSLDDAEIQPHLGDIPRICSNAPGNNLPDASVQREHSSNGCLYEALIADPRNEDTLILSQLVVLFHKLHNKIVDLLEANGFSTNGREVFERAREITIRCYQSVVVEDFLNRLLDEDLRDRYREKSCLEDFEFLNKLVRKHGIVPIPLEFSLAALRIGHAMIRPKYSLNKDFDAEKQTDQTISTLLNFNGGVRSAKIPVANDWVITWEKFFPTTNLEGEPCHRDYNPSRLIRPSFATHLCTAPQFQPNVEHRANAPADGNWGGLAYRDLARAYDLGLPNGQYLAGRFGVDKLKPEDIKDGLEDFDRDFSGEDNPVAQHVETLSQNTPLLYYLLREAELCHGGKRLGPLGSSIIAEVILGTLRAYDQPGEELTDEEIANILGLQIVPRTMPALIAFVDRL